LLRELRTLRRPVTAAFRLDADQAQGNPWVSAARDWAAQHPSASLDTALLHEQITAAQAAADRSDAPATARADLTYHLARLETTLATHAVLGRLSAAPALLPAPGTADPLRDLSATLARQQHASRDREMILATFPTLEHAHTYVTGRIASLDDYARNAARGLRSVTRTVPALADNPDIVQAVEGLDREVDALRRALTRLEEVAPAVAAPPGGLDAQAIAAATARAMARPTAPPATARSATRPGPDHTAQQSAASHQQQRARPTRP
jgi:hypothetical protein